MPGAIGSHFCFWSLSGPHNLAETEIHLQILVSNFTSSKLNHQSAQLLVMVSNSPPPIVVAVCRSERLLPPSVALKNYRLRGVGPLAGSSASCARISPLSSVLGCSRLPPPVSARAVRVGCCSLSVVVSARFCLPVSLESRLGHWHLVVRLSRRRRQKQLVGLSLASSPFVGWLPTRRQPL
ncbi:hypothetical protein S83_018612, partial [Arachis hypogaea]